MRWERAHGCIDVPYGKEGSGEGGLDYQKHYRVAGLSVFLG